MRFELSIALKYLIPRFKQPSVAIISMVSTLVVAMVVWLVLVFLSVTEGLEKKWINELISVNAPLRITPTDAYYQSYYYHIDSLSAESGYATKTIGEKLLATQSDPYDPNFDSALPLTFPRPEQDKTGMTLDLVKELFSVIDPLANEHHGLKASEYEVSFGTLQFNVTQESSGFKNTHNEHSFISQLSYIASHNLKDSNLSNMIVPPTAHDYYNILRTSFLNATAPETASSHFFEQVKVIKLKPSPSGYILPEPLYPEEGSLHALAFHSGGTMYKISIPSNEKELPRLEKESKERAMGVIKGKVHFSKEGAHFVAEDGTNFSTLTLPLVLEDSIILNSELEKESIATAKELADLRFTIEGKVQTLPIKGSIYLDDLHFAEVSPLVSNHPHSLWVCKGDNCIPSSSIGQGVIISKHFKNNGIRLGDKGSIAYTSSSLSSIQEQKLPIYVAGFYDPGLFPMGNKLIFAEPSLIAGLRSNLTIADGMLGNGLHLWLKESKEADTVKAKVQKALFEKGLDQYWTIESYKDYEFAKPILTQLKSDKNLFTLIAIIILVVACSNIISMLILLVNDKKREIAIMQAMGASSRRIGLIFGICGFVIGLLSSIIGIILSLVTLKHLQSLVDFLSFLQGHDAFQAAFYGSGLPNELSLSALLFVLIATTLISLIAALVPAIKASKIRPSQMLRSEG